MSSKEALPELLHYKKDIEKDIEVNQLLIII